MGYATKRGIETAIVGLSTVCFSSQALEVPCSMPHFMGLGSLAGITVAIERHLVVATLARYINALALSLSHERAVSPFQTIIRYVCNADVDCCLCIIIMERAYGEATACHKVGLGSADGDEKVYKKGLRLVANVTSVIARPSH